MDRLSDDLKQSLPEDTTAPTTATSSALPSSDSSTSALSPTISGPFHKIDVHTHILPEHIPDLTARFGDYGKWVKLVHHESCKAKMYKGNDFFREIEENCYRPEPRIKDCDNAGVTVQVLSTVPVMFSYWARPEDCLDLCRLLNDHIAALVKRFPKRFVGLATLPMQHPEYAVQELERCMTEKGFAGIQIGSHINQWPLSDPHLFPIFQAAERLGAAIFVHPWDMAGEEIMKKYWLPWLVGMPAESSFAICSLIFGGVFEKLPNLRWCFAHGGGSFPGTIGRIEHGWSVRPDLCAIDCKRNPREYVGKFWLDSLVHDEVQLHAIVKLMGDQKVCLGSDYPFPLGEDRPGTLVEQCKHLTEEQKARILWGNGLAFLGLKEEQFVDRKDNKLPAVEESSAAQDTADDGKEWNVGTSREVREAFASASLPQPEGVSSSSAV